jgi:RimJ/RimL family protein N-acetyltransferase
MVLLDHPRTSSEWNVSEHLLIIGANNQKDLSPRVTAFLSTVDQQDDLRGVKDGNILFLVTNGIECLHRGYIRLIDPGASDAKSVFFGGFENAPEIRSCETAPQARGKGLYRRVLNEQLRYLQALGHDRAVLYVMAENVASIKGATAAGFKLTRTLHDWIVFNLLVFQRVREAGSARWRLFLRSR